jgi:hypothetical protein
MRQNTASRPVIRALEEFEDEQVVSLDPVVREVLEETAPVPSARWRLYLYRDFFFLRRD